MSEGCAATETMEISVSQSSREYSPTASIKSLIEQEKIAEKPIAPDSKVCLIGDGQGADTQQFSTIVNPENIMSINFDPREVIAANDRFEKEGSPLRMKQGDITNIDSLHAAGVNDGTQDLVVAAHVLEVPIFNTQIGDESTKQMAVQNEKLFTDNIAQILKPDGEALVFSYAKRLSPEQAKGLGVEKVSPEAATQYGVEWRPGMTYAELSTIRSKEELTTLFDNKFSVKIEDTPDGYMVRLKKKSTSP